MKNKVTIKDIARESGVSVATVSYVLNNRTDQKISDETKKKILQIVNLLGYTSSPAARSLATGKTGNIAIYLSSSPFALKQAEQMLVLDMLSEQLKMDSYQLLYLSKTQLTRVDNADAIVCLGTSTDFFYSIADNNFIPLLMLDGIVDDALFFQINEDYSYIASYAKEQLHTKNFITVCYDSENIQLKNRIENSFDNVRFIQSFEDIKKLSSLDLPILSIGTYLSSYLMKTSQQVISYHLPLKQKLKQLSECISFGINRVIMDCHDIVVH